MHSISLHKSLTVRCILFCSLACTLSAYGKNSILDTLHGAVIRGDTSTKKIALVFTAHDYGDGAATVTHTLEQQKIQASFFLTGDFYRNKRYEHTIKKLISNGNYLGVHSDKHLLYCDWEKRDSLLLSKDAFNVDLDRAYAELKRFGIIAEHAQFFLPPYEWYNDSIAHWTKQRHLQLINFTPGTRSNADYTFPEMGARYINSLRIIQSVLNFEQQHTNGLNGFILLFHLGTDPRRKDKLYNHLPHLITILKQKGYHFCKINELLEAPTYQDATPQGENKM